ncbi:hypothetical protein [Thermococcus sp. MAR1]|uniref:hypothetical protein n=1 Tax=Thermococcus sp. MAR1 TaxID=1638263 RepID=UPI00143BCB77|nr:hypothetical protein [Thermococcus sp. MAR1]NJE10239.1 hypothetical protein [Thermococcus sp. MAR1]
MKRKSTIVKIPAPKEAIERVLDDAPSFITNWPYVVRVSTKDGLTAEIELPRFVFKFRDVYRFQYAQDFNSYVYEGTGEKSHLILVVTLKEWQKETEAAMELSYKGRGEFFLGKTLQLLVEGIAKGLRELAEGEALKPTAESLETQKLIEIVDFSDPMSVANFLSKSKMVYTGLHIIERGKFLEVVGDLRKDIGETVLYVSGVTQDGLRSFKILLAGTQVRAVEYRDEKGVLTIKVKDEDSARSALELISRIEGPHMINVWVPVGGV